MSPSSPALRSSFAQAVIRWSAASTSSGGSSQPISAALPESSAHRSTRASFAAASRRSFAFFGATSITAAAMAARSPPGVSRAARSRTLSSAARASASSSSAVARAMISALYRVIVPSSSAAAVPGSRVSQGLGQVDQVPGPAAGLRQRVGQLVCGELFVLGGGVAAGQLGDGGELAGRGVGLDPVPRAHHPDQLGLRHPGETAVLARCGVSGDRQGRAARQHVQRHPGAERRRGAGRLAGEDPRRAGLARAPPPGGGRLHGEQLIGGGLADLGQLLRGERLDVLELVRAGRLIVFADPVQAPPPARPPSSDPDASRRDHRPTLALREPVPEACTTTRSE